MTRERASRILNVILQGIDPVTGEILPEDHFCNQPDVLRALHLAISALAESQQSAKPAPDPKRNAGRAWTREDNEALRRLYQSGVSMDEICQLLQRRVRGVNRQLEYLGLIDESAPIPRRADSTLSRAGQRWNQDEDQRLERMFTAREPIERIAEALCRTPYAVFCRMEKQGLFGDVEGYPIKEEVPLWRNEDTAALREMVSEGKTIQEIAERFGRSEKGISARMFYLGLTGNAPDSARIRQKIDE